MDKNIWLDCKNYLGLSKTAESVNNKFMDPFDFAKTYREFTYEKKEEDSFIRHVIINNNIFAFQERPMLFEQIILYIANNLSVETNDVKLIGSAKTGFSISSDNYGNHFVDSDLDFTVINDQLFNTLKDEFLNLRYEYEKGTVSMTPQNLKYWKDSLPIIPKNINRGFIDPNKIPYIPLSPTAIHIEEVLWPIKDHLKKIHSLNIRKSSIRVYRDFSSFVGQLKLNTKYVINSVSKQK